MKQSVVQQNQNFIFSDQAKIEIVGDGIRRQILGFNAQLMMVRIWFDQGSIGYVHEHYHSQVSYIESGEFDVSIDNVIKRMKTGDSFYIPPNIEHGAVCIKKGVLLDVFSPAREDFLETEVNK